MCGCLPHPVLSPKDLVCNPGMSPNWDSNQQPFGSQAGTQSTEPHQPGLEKGIFRTVLEIPALERSDSLKASGNLDKNLDPGYISEPALGSL